MKINISREDFVKKAYPYAKMVLDNFGIQLIISISQAAHESNFGNSDLAIQANNLFGIKASESWIKKGGKVWIGRTFEYINNEKVYLKDGFRMYDSWEASFTDWALLISQSSLYKQAYEYAKQGLVKEYAEAILTKFDKNGKVIKWGYTTDREYPRKLVEVAQVVRKIANEKLGIQI
jgi:flagellum-specific peptidoglycan hydrolase FlgJ